MDIKEKIANIVKQAGLDENSTLVEDIEKLVSTGIESKVAAEKAKLEEDVKAQIEILAEDTAQRIQDAKEEGKLLAEQKIEYIADKFVQENKQQLVMTEEYHRMQKTVDAIKSAFVDIDFGSEKDLEIRRLQEDRDSVIADYANIKQQYFQQQCYLEFNTLTEDLTDIEKEKVKNIINHASYNSIDEYKSIVEDVKENIKKDDKKGDDSDDKEGKKGCDGKKEPKNLNEDLQVSPHMNAYLAVI